VDLPALRDRLGAARGAGLPFAEVWPREVERALVGVRERRKWAEALSATEAAWRRAYGDVEGERVERALGALIDPERTVPGPYGFCAACDRPLAPGPKQRRYCSEECQRAPNEHDL
jgi:hypothetical protein